MAKIVFFEDLEKGPEASVLIACLSHKLASNLMQPAGCNTFLKKKSIMHDFSRNRVNWFCVTHYLIANHNCVPIASLPC